MVLGRRFDDRTTSNVLAEDRNAAAGQWRSGKGKLNVIAEFAASVRRIRHISMLHVFGKAIYNKKPCN
jgi:hypothetical protein